MFFPPLTFCVCTFVRSLLAYIASGEYAYYTLLILVPVSIAWLLMVLGVVVRDTGMEAMGKIWWKDNRKYHLLLYVLAIWCIYNEMPEMAGYLLYADVLYGGYMQMNYRLTMQS